MVRLHLRMPLQLPAPIEGWDTRILDYAVKGNATWPNPCTPDGKPALQPWPFPWLLAVSNAERSPPAEDPGATRRGFWFAPTVCAKDDKPIHGAEGARCARCGIEVCNRCAGISLMASFGDVPSCEDCHPHIKKLLGIR